MRVGAWWGSREAGGEIVWGAVIDNRSELPIYDVACRYIRFDPTAPQFETQLAVAYNRMFEQGRTFVTSPPELDAWAARDPDSVPYVDVSLNFRDSAGNTWTRDSTGFLTFNGPAKPPRPPMGLGADDWVNDAADRLRKRLHRRAWRAVALKRRPEGVESARAAVRRRLARRQAWRLWWQRYRE